MACYRNSFTFFTVAVRILYLTLLYWNIYLIIVAANMIILSGCGIWFLDQRDENKGEKGGDRKIKIWKCYLNIYIT
jgi:hypothetical protein